MRSEYEPNRVVLLGPPGAGKGTQADAIAARLGVPHISTGDVFRRNIKEDTDLGRAAKNHMDGGELVPDELTMAMVGGRLDEDDAIGGFLLDGFPRNLNQARHLDELLGRSGQTVELVLELHAPVDVIVHRLNGRRMCETCGRSWHVELNATRVEGICDMCAGHLYQRDDDREDVIRHRIELYEQQTSPLLGYYRERGSLVRIDALGLVDVVTDRVLAALTTLGAEVTA